MRTAVAQVEDAIDLLKHLPASVWLLYLAGAVPMVLAVLWFARDMLSGYLAGRCLPESLLCAVVFFFAAFWKARFARALVYRLNSRENSFATDRNSSWQCARVQGCVQALKLAALPLAALSLLPLPWVSALFRNASTEANRPGATFGGTLRRAALQASAGAGATSVAFLLCSLAGLVLFINLFVLSLLLPQLLKSFTGWESDWTRTTGAWANGNVFRVALAMTWLLLDPLLQACSAVRSFHYEARTDGRDLLVTLRRMAAAVLLLCVVSASYARAASRPQASVEPAKPGAPGHSLTAADIARGVEGAKGKDEYAWLRASKEDEDENWFGVRLVHDIGRALSNINSWMKKLGHWIDRLFAPRDPSIRVAKPPGKNQAVEMQWILYLLGGALVIATVVLLLRTRRRVTLSALAGEAPTPALRLDVAADVMGSEHGEEEWLKAARDHAGRGEWRLAVRAMYLSNLAHLGSTHLIAIQRSKSNGMYERELRLRCRTLATQEAFARANRAYERVWYGRHEATAELHESFEQDLQVMRSHG